jgi:hypothetical protein
VSVPTEREPKTAIFLFLRISPVIIREKRRRRGKEWKARIEERI